MQREIEEMRAALTAYIEATYHLSHPKTVAIRRQLLDRPGGVSQEPYVESTPTYLGERRFEQLALRAQIREFLSHLAAPEQGCLLFNPPYEHQAQALELTQRTDPGGTGVVVTTGTGSGKTEAFLLPVLARLAEEAAERPSRFQTRAVRALLLYPMNALVNDQLGRLRTLFGDNAVRGWFQSTAGRPAKFGRYTGRTLYPGRRDGKRDQDRLKSLSYYLDLEDGAHSDPEKLALLETLKRKGRWPTKPDSTDGAHDGLRGWFGSRSKRWEDAAGRPQRAIERVQDAELLTRHEMQRACPDLLVTNYSMLEYMLLRPIERSLFDETRDFFHKHPDEKFIFVLDEAHLYRGANGTEVAYLIRRFLDRLDLDTSRVVFICTSASFSEPEAAKRFASQLTGLDVAAITVLNGRKKVHLNAAVGDRTVAQIFADAPLECLASVNARERAKTLAPILAGLSIAEPEPVMLTRMTKDTARSVRIAGLDHRGAEIDEVLDLAHATTVSTAKRYAVVTEVEPEQGSIRFGRPGNVTLGLATHAGVIWDQDDLARAAWLALKDRPLIALLKNLTSGAVSETDAVPVGGSAKSISELSKLLFPGVPSVLSLRATDALLELASLARPANGEAPVLPARVHLMFRGLPGLWACVDPECSDLDEELRGGPTGALYAEPRRHCQCGSQVYELWSCRACGLAVGRAYVGAPVGEQHLWADDGASYGGDMDVVRQAHICLEAPRPAGAAAATASVSELDVVTGRLDGDSQRTRPVWHAPGRPSLFDNCPRCGAHEQISDLQTKGEEPFQQLVAVQVLAQPPRPESHAPMKGRKALVFSDGRQTASRLAGLMKTFAFRDSVRPLLLDGMAALARSPYRPSLDDAPLAVGLSAALNDVRLRPVGDETGALFRFGRTAKEYLEDGNVELEEISGVSRDTSAGTPLSVFQNIYAVLQDRHTGLSALALATVAPKFSRTDNQTLEGLVPPVAAELSPQDSRAAVIDLWLWCALHARAIKLGSTPLDVEQMSGASGIGRWNGRFNEGVRRALSAAGHAAWWNQFPNTDLPLLKRVFSGSTDQSFQISARKVSLVPGEAVTWRRCKVCTLVSPENPLLSDHCPACAGKTEVIDPATDQVFRSRKAFFRRASERLAAHEPGFAPHQLIAEEHSAQLNDTSMARAMSRNEAYELRFQDVPISQDGQVSDPIDVLSCTTTMEVGIDIGGLTAVALRNVPPGRANYQQRSGRAGRRGAGLSTVLMFCGADSHDQSFFRNPAPIVAGPAPDPVLNLDNTVIAERQAFAFLLGRFQQARVVGTTNPNIFESLGLTIDFLNDDDASFSLAGLKGWLKEHQEKLTVELDVLFGKSCPALDSVDLLKRWPLLLEEKLGAFHPPRPDAQPAVTDGDDDPLEADAPDNSRSGAGSAKLLDQLFALGLMPRYAFPTDVATFAVFQDNTNAYRPQLLYSPQQALNQALGQYAPGHEVWVDGKTHISMGIWSAFEDERWAAYQQRKLYYHCQTCDFAMLKPWNAGFVGETLDCPACNARGGMGPAQRWLRPVGFAHPPAMPPAPPRIEGTINSRPTRAKLDAPYFRADLRVGGHKFDSGAGWEAWCDNLDLVVTNHGTQSAQDQGFRHCPQCGRTEPADLDVSMRQLTAADHDRPRPRKPGESDRCNGRSVRIVLGNQFRTDIAVFRLQMPASWDLSPTRAATVISAKSAVEALIRAASQDLEPGDIDGDYRFAPGQNATTLLDLYIYDQAAGGAGFVRAAAADPERLVCAAIKVLEDCTCEDSCYQCLRSYKNRFDHALLDRRLGADLLRSCFLGTEPILPDVWAEDALRRLCDDMNDSGGDYKAHRGGLVGADGKRVVLAHPFRPKEPGNASARTLAAGASEARVVDIMMVDRALPIATAQALDKMVKSTRVLPQSPDGAPLMTIKAILAGESLDRAPKVATGPHEPGDFVMNLDANTLDGPLGDNQRAVLKGTPCLFRPVNGGPLDGKTVYLLRRTDGRAFGATQSEWTVGTPQPTTDGIRVRYRAAPKRLECASEVVAPPGAVEAIATFVRQLL